MAPPHPLHTMVRIATRAEKLTTRHSGGRLRDENGHLVLSTVHAFFGVGLVATGTFFGTRLWLHREFGSAWVCFSVALVAKPCILNIHVEVDQEHNRSIHHQWIPFS